MPDPIPTPDASRRDRVVRVTVGASVAAKVISVACTLAQVPLAWHALGGEAYGLWITLMSVLVMLNFLDFGLGVGMQKAMAAAFGANDTTRLRQTFNTGVVALSGLAVVALAVGVPVALCLDWGDWLKIHDAALRPLAGPALALTVAAFAVGLPFNAVPRLAMATQRGWLQALWIAVASVASLALVAYAAQARWAFLPFLTLTALLPAAQGFAFWQQLRRALGWPRWNFALLPRTEWRALAGDSLLFAVPQVGLAFVQAAPPLALALAAGPVAAAAFNLLQRLFSPVTQGQIMFLTPLWPAITEAQVRGDSAWIRRAFRQSLVVAAGCAAALALLTGQSDLLLGWWVGASAVTPSAPLAWLTCGWFVAQVLWQPFMYLLVALGRLRVLAAWSLAGVGLSLAGMALALAAHAGAPGVLAAATLGLALGGLPGLVAATGDAIRSAIPPGSALPPPAGRGRSPSGRPSLVVFKLNHLGDNVVFLPGVQALRARFPDWRITVITTPQEKVLYEQLVPADDLLTCGKAAFDKCWQRPWELARWHARVRARRADACLVSFDQANVPHFLARATGAPIRVGGNLQHIRFRGTLTHDLPLPASGWVAEWNWATARTIARELGGAELPATPPPPDLSHLLGVSSARPSPPAAVPAPLPGRPRVVIHAGASTTFKRWPQEHFTAVAGRLAAECDVLWIDRPETAAALLPAGVRRAAPDSLRALATLLAGADLFLGNNSGPMHVANALGLRGVVVTGSTAPGWDPYWHRERWAVLRHPQLPCQPCEPVNRVVTECGHAAAPFACLRYWSVDAVTAACRAALARTPPAAIP